MSVGTFTPSTSPSIGAFTSVTTPTMRPITYGDHPRLDGSVTYGQLIGEGGFFASPDTPTVGVFTPSG